MKIDWQNTKIDWRITHHAAAISSMDENAWYDIILMYLYRNIILPLQKFTHNTILKGQYDMAIQASAVGLYKNCEVSL